MKKPLVSILCITFNQEKYIRQAFDSFLMQQTPFPFEIIVHDDASTDKTKSIIKEYADKYPDIFVPLYEKQNQYSQGNMEFVRDMLTMARGEFIAECEGDDYWTDSKKLQKQVKFMQTHPTYALCFHPVRVFFETGELPDAIFPDEKKPAKFTTAHLLRSNFIQSNSVMYRKQDYKDLVTDITPLDWYTHLYHARFGKIGFLPETMSAYRRHENGIWWSKDRDEFWHQNGVRYLGMFTAVMDLFGERPEYRAIIEPSIIQMFQRLVAVDNSKGTRLVLEASQKYPESAELFIKRQDESLQHEEKELELRNWVIGRLITDISRTMEHADLVVRSKSFMAGYYTLHPWKVPRKVASIGKQQAIQVRSKLQKRGDLPTALRQYEALDKKIAQFQNAKHKKIAVIIHLYYPDLWEYFAEHLRVLDPALFDLFVTLPKEDAKTEAEILRVYPDACLLISPNRGRDVLPFLKVITRLPEKGYEYVLKLHSKKSKHWQGGDAWLRSITETLLPDDAQALHSILDTLKKKDTGIVGPAGHYVSFLVNYEPNKSTLRSTLRELKSAKTARYIDAYRHEYGFFAGTMFWARIDALSTILSHAFGPEDFEAEAGQVDATLAHTIERLLCVIPELEDKKVYAADLAGAREIPYRTYNIPEWADVHIAKIRQEKPSLEHFERSATTQK